MSKEIRIRFQYNSCYCLSSTRRPVCLQNSYFNTTLVTVYRIISFPCLLLNGEISIQLLLLFICTTGTLVVVLSYFNTTLVTVYRHSWCRQRLWLRISIQLLLLFIYDAGIKAAGDDVHFNTTLVTVYH